MSRKYKFRNPEAIPAAARLHRVASKLARKTKDIKNRYCIEKRIIGYCIDLKLLPHDAIVQQRRGRRGGIVKKDIYKNTKICTTKI